LLERDQLHAMGSGWTLAGVRQSGRHPAELPLARAAIRRWETLAGELDADLEYRQHGNLRLALDEAQIATIKRVVADGNAAGVPMEYLEPDAVRELAPVITEKIAGASLCPTDGHANNHKTVQAYAHAAQRHGATFVTGVEVLNLATSGDSVTGVVTADGTYAADVVVVAAGIYTPHLVTPLGLQLPIEIVHCPVAQTVPTDALRLEQVLGVASGGFAARQTASGAIRFIGASIPWGERHHTKENTGMTVQQMDAMTRNASAILPELAKLRIELVWGGLIDRTPDVIPVLDAVEGYPGLVVGAGFSGHGFGIGPISGEILANLATSGNDDRFDLAPFRLSRFADGRVKRESLEMHG
jgi:sarcosine oxidase subunit beta